MPPAAASSGHARVRPPWCDGSTSSGKCCARSRSLGTRAGLGARKCAPAGGGGGGHGHDDVNDAADCIPSAIAHASSCPRSLAITPPASKAAECRQCGPVLACAAQVLGSASTGTLSNSRRPAVRTLVVVPLQSAHVSRPPLHSRRARAGWRSGSSSMQQRCLIISDALGRGSLRSEIVPAPRVS